MMLVLAMKTRSRRKRRAIGGVDDFILSALVWQVCSSAIYSAVLLWASENAVWIPTQLPFGAKLPTGAATACFGWVVFPASVAVAGPQHHVRC